MTYKVKISIIVLLVSFISFVTGAFFSNLFPKNAIKTNMLTQPESELKPLEKYTIENMSNSEIIHGELLLGETLEQNNEFTSKLISYRFDSDLDSKLDKKTSGVINLPNESGSYPLIIMLRGYVDQKIYKSGTGTKNAAAYFAKNGFITISPDFLGYAGSDSEVDNIFESRFQTYVTVYSLLNYFENNPDITSGSSWKISDIFLWGHSNGGQIALTILEISQKIYPTVLWAPVSKPFPYSVLYYTDESEDRGKLIRSKLGEFEKLYDVEKYSLTNYLDRIKAPLQIHQGSRDDAVPQEWTESLVKELKKNNSEINYFIYPGADHNLQPDWNSAITKDLDFYNKNLQN